MTHLPWSPLAAVLERRHLSMAQLARLANTTRRTVLRYKAAGSLPEPAADRVAVALGLTPEAVWGEAWAALGREAVEREAARQRALVAAKQRRYMARHPEAVEQRRQYSADYRAQFPDASRSYAKAYYERNRERMIRLAVERKRQKRAAA